MATKPDSLMEMRLKYYSRGVNKVEDPKAEAELVGPDGKIVGRVKRISQNSSQTTMSFL